MLRYPRVRVGALNVCPRGEPMPEDNAVHPLPRRTPGATGSPRPPAGAGPPVLSEALRQRVLSAIADEQERDAAADQARAPERNAAAGLPGVPKCNGAADLAGAAERYGTADQAGARERDRRPARPTHRRWRPRRGGGQA